MYDFNFIVQIATIIGLVITVIALFSAIISSRQIKNIQNSLSTKYIGEFPQYIPEVIKLIKKSKKNIIILYGVPTYGLFSSYDDWIDYEYEVRKKAGKIPVEIGYLNETKREELQREQFSLTNDNWNEKIQEPYFKGRAEKFFENFDDDKKNLEEYSTIKFLELLDKQQDDALDKSFQKANKKEISTSIAMNFWIVDGKEAIFTVPNYSDRPTELGFITSDTKLIQALIAIYERYKANNS